MSNRQTKARQGHYNFPYGTDSSPFAVGDTAAVTPRLGAVRCGRDGHPRRGGAVERHGPLFPGTGGGRSAPHSVQRVAEFASRAGSGPEPAPGPGGLRRAPQHRREDGATANRLLDGRAGAFRTNPGWNAGNHQSRTSRPAHQFAFGKALFYDRVRRTFAHHRRQLAAKRRGLRARRR